MKGSVFEQLCSTVASEVEAPLTLPLELAQMWYYTEWCWQSGNNTSQGETQMGIPGVHWVTVVSSMCAYKSLATPHTCKPHAVILMKD